jgi:hypothetical protein
MKESHAEVMKLINVWMGATDEDMEEMIPS